MAIRITRKTDQEGEPPREEALAPSGDLPNSLSPMRDEYEQLVDRFFRSLSTLGRGAGWRVEFEDQADQFLVRAEVPGFELRDLAIQLAGNRLILEAEARALESGERNWYQVVALPGGIDPEKVEATYRDGVLEITLPKTPQAKGRRVPIQRT